MKIASTRKNDDGTWQVLVHGKPHGPSAKRREQAKHRADLLNRTVSPAPKSYKEGITADQVTVAQDVTGEFIVRINGVSQPGSHKRQAQAEHRAAILRRNLVGAPVPEPPAEETEADE